MQREQLLIRIVMVEEERDFQGLKWFLGCFLHWLFLFYILPDLWFSLSFNEETILFVCLSSFVFLGESKKSIAIYGYCISKLQDLFVCEHEFLQIA